MVRARFASALALLASVVARTAGVAALLGSAASGATAATASPVPSGADAPPSTQFERVWHFGRVTGDLSRIIAFYHDVLGLEVRGGRDQKLPFLSNAALDEFVATPGAQFRAVHFLIPGASHISDPAEGISLEAFEYRGIDRAQVLPALSRSGVSNLRFLVPDLDRTIVAAKEADVAFITASGTAVSVPTPTGFEGKARAVMLRDPDGYPVELMQLDPSPPSQAPANSHILGAMMTLVVADLDASLRFYQQFLGDGVASAVSGPWQTGDGVETMRALAPLQHRTALITLPGSALRLELLQFRSAHQSPYRPVFRDIGHGHIAFYTHDIAAALTNVRGLGGHTLSRTGTWTAFNAKLRGFYTRDRDGFFLEVIERD